jgi:hypothetical protein
VGRAGEEDLVAPLDAHDDGGGDAGEVLEAAVGAGPRQLRGPALRRGAAPAAEPVVAVPLQHLHRPSGELPGLLVEPAPEPAQTFEGHPLRRLGLRWQPGGIARDPAQEADGVRLPGIEPEPRPLLSERYPGCRAGSRAFGVLLVDQQLAAPKGEPEPLRIAVHGRTQVTVAR